MVASNYDLLIHDTAMKLGLGFNEVSASIDVLLELGLVSCEELNKIERTKI